MKKNIFLTVMVISLLSACSDSKKTETPAAAPAPAAAAAPAPASPDNAAQATGTEIQQTNEDPKDTVIRICKQRELNAAQEEKCKQEETAANNEIHTLKGLTQDMIDKCLDAPNSGYVDVLQCLKKALAAAPAADGSVKVKLAQILKDYTDNEVNGDKLYKGKRVEVSGRVNDVKNDLMNHPYVTVGTGADFEIPVFQATFDDDKAGQLTQLRKGKTITVVCQVDGLMLNVQGSDCVLK